MIQNITKYSTHTKKYSTTLKHKIVQNTDGNTRPGGGCWTTADASKHSKIQLKQIDKCDNQTNVIAKQILHLVPIKNHIL